MYVFADYKGIVDMRELALRKLRRALGTFTLYDSGVSDLIRLLEYIFENTTDKEDEHDSLRVVVFIYTACKVEHLWRNTTFQELPS